MINNAVYNKGTYKNQTNFYKNYTMISSKRLTSNNNATNAVLFTYMLTTM